MNYIDTSLKSMRCCGFFLSVPRYTERKMYASTSNEFKSVTGTDTTNNRVSHTLQGSSSQRTSRTANLTTEHSLGNSSVSEGTIKLQKCCASSKAL
jgi:hypothetical protein